MEFTLAEIKLVMNAIGVLGGVSNEVLNDIKAKIREDDKKFFDYIDDIKKALDVIESCALIQSKIAASEIGEEMTKKELRMIRKNVKFAKKQQQEFAEVMEAYKKISRK